MPLRLPRRLRAPRAALALLLLLPAAPRAAPLAAQDARPVVDAEADAVAARSVFVELDLPVAVFVGQHVRAAVRFGVEESFASERLVPLFRRELDLPVQVRAPWHDAAWRAAHGVRLGPAAPVTDAASVAAGGAPALAERLAERELDGATFAVHELARELVFERPGELEVPAPTVQLAHAARFEESLIRGRVAIDPVEATVRGEALVVDVLPLPEAGRPESSVGVVGALEVEARAAATEVALGDSFEFVLAFEGDVAGLEPPALADLPGLRPRGRTVERSGRRVVARYDLVATDAGLREVPSIEVSFFGPDAPAGWRTVRTAPLPLTVRAPAPPPAPAAPPPPAPRSGWPAPPWLLALGAAVLLTIGVRIRRRRARRPTRRG